MKHDFDELPDEVQDFLRAEFGAEAERWAEPFYNLIKFKFAPATAIHAELVENVEQLRKLERTVQKARKLASGLSSRPASMGKVPLSKRGLSYSLWADELSEIEGDVRALLSHLVQYRKAIAPTGGHDAVAFLLGELVASVFEVMNEKVTFGEADGLPSTRFGRVVRFLISFHGHTVGWKAVASNAFRESRARTSSEHHRRWRAF